MSEAKAALKYLGTCINALHLELEPSIANDVSAAFRRLVSALELERLTPTPAPAVAEGAALPDRETLARVIHDAYGRSCHWPNIDTSWLDLVPGLKAGYLAAADAVRALLATPPQPPSESGAHRGDDRNFWTPVRRHTEKCSDAACPEEHVCECVDHSPAHDDCHCYSPASIYEDRWVCGTCARGHTPPAPDATARVVRIALTIGRRLNETQDVRAVWTSHYDELRAATTAYDAPRPEGT